LKKRNIWARWQKAERAARNIAEIIGPAESPLAKIRGRFRFQMLIKGQDINVLHQIAREILQKSANNVVKITADVDPENFM